MGILIIIGLGYFIVGLAIAIIGIIMTLKSFTFYKKNVKKQSKWNKLLSISLIMFMSIGFCIIVGGARITYIGIECWISLINEINKFK